MPDPAPRYFKLRSDIDPDQPLHRWAGRIALPRMSGGQVVVAAQPVTIKPAVQRDDALPGRILPGTRIVEVTNPILAAALDQSPSFVEGDPPVELQARKRSGGGRQTNDGADGARRN